MGERPWWPWTAAGCCLTPRLMRKTLLLLSAALSLTMGGAIARPLDVHVYGGHYSHHHRGIGGYLVRHGLLTREQAACAVFVPGRLGSRRVQQLSVFQRSGGRCPGEVAERPAFLFDVYVDRVSGVV